MEINNVNFENRDNKQTKKINKNLKFEPQMQCDLISYLNEDLFTSVLCVVKMHLLQIEH